MTPNQDWNRLGQSAAQRLADGTADWQVYYIPEEDVYRVRHLSSGESVDVTMYDLVRHTNATPTVLKNAILRVALQKLLKERPS